MNSVQDILSNLEKIFTATEEALCEWNGKGNLQFPVLIGLIATKLSWDEKQVRENDPFVRYYVRNHSEWFVTRGAHGGVMRVADKNKKATKPISTAKDKLKEEMKAAIEAKVANDATPTKTMLVDTTNVVEDLNSLSNLEDDSDLENDFDLESNVDLDEVLNDKE